MRSGLYSYHRRGHGRNGNLGQSPAIASQSQQTSMPAEIVTSWGRVGNVQEYIKETLRRRQEIIARAEEELQKFNDRFAENMNKVETDLTQVDQELKKLFNLREVRDLSPEEADREAQLLDRAEKLSIMKQREIERFEYDKNDPRGRIFDYVRKVKEEVARLDSQMQEVLKIDEERKAAYQASQSPVTTAPTVSTASTVSTAPGAAPVGTGNMPIIMPPMPAQPAGMMKQGHAYVPTIYQIPGGGFTWGWMSVKAQVPGAPIDPTAWKKPAPGPQQLPAPTTPPGQAPPPGYNWKLGFFEVRAGRQDPTRRTAMWAWFPTPAPTLRPQPAYGPPAQAMPVGVRESIAKALGPKPPQPTEGLKPGYMWKLIIDYPKSYNGMTEERMPRWLWVQVPVLEKPVQDMVTNAAQQISKMPPEQQPLMIEKAAEEIARTGEAPAAAPTPPPTEEKKGIVQKIKDSPTWMKVAGAAAGALLIRSRMG